MGEGGFAIVYCATYLQWKRPVAVKVFKALGEVLAQHRQQLLDNFIQEGRLFAELPERSAAIGQARDAGMLITPCGENVPYMVLEWLDGQSLAELLVVERAEALALAHKQGIAHRDVKPADIFVLSGDAGVKLPDFGIVKVVQDTQKMGFEKTAGHITSFTPLYGAPEQFNRAFGSTGPWTDVFALALALIITKVVSGREPMTGDTLVQLAFTSDPNRRPTPRTLGATVSDAIEAIFAKAVAVQPEDRHQTVGELWNALVEASMPIAPALRRCQ